jgi:hypothetical protein
VIEEWLPSRMEMESSQEGIKKGFVAENIPLFDWDMRA